MAQDVAAGNSGRQPFHVNAFEKKKTTSYKIELDKENYIFGLKKFSVQKPLH